MRSHEKWFGDLRGDTDADRRRTRSLLEGRALTAMAALARARNPVAEAPTDRAASAR